MELTLLLCSALAQVVTHELIAQVLHGIWCLRQISHEATHANICRRIRLLLLLLLQIHNLVRLYLLLLKYWANVGARNRLLSQPNSDVLEYLLLHQLILRLELLNLLLQLLTQVHIGSITCHPSPVTHQRWWAWLGNIGWLCHHIVALRCLDVTLRHRLAWMRTLS